MFRLSRFGGFRAGRGLLLLCLLAGPVPAWSAACGAVDPDALNLLNRMSRSLRETNYHGVFTYRHGNSVRSVRVSHTVENGTETGEVAWAAAQVRVEHPLDCDHPGHRLTRLTDGLHGGDCGVARHYRLLMDKREKSVAKRRAVTVQVLPRDIYRYGYRMVLDAETGMLLKALTLAHNGRVLERFEFVDLRIDPAAAPQDKARRSGQGGGAAAGADGFGGSRPARPWRVNWVPDGFILSAGDRESALNKTYTDGLASFSVFLESAPELERPGEGRARLGGTTSYTRGRALDKRPVLITVLGEVPINTARMVADSIRWGGSGAD